MTAQLSKTYKITYSYLKKQKTLDRGDEIDGHVIKNKKGDFRVPELRFPNFRICDFELQEYSAEYSG